MSKNHPNRFETTIQEFRNPRTGSNIHLIGMIHVAQPEFYDTIQQKLRERDTAGSDIHYELVKRDDKPDYRLGLVAKMGIMKRSADMMGALFQGLGLVSQLDHIKLEEHWQNHDITLEQFVDTMKLRKVMANSAGAFVVSKLIGKVPVMSRAKTVRDSLEQVEDGILSNRLRPVKSTEVMQVQEFMGIAQNDIIIGCRNGIALSAVDDTLRTDPERDVTLMWGEAHLLGLAHGIKQRGYDHVDSQRVTAIEYAQMFDAARDTAQSDVVSFELATLYDR